MVDVTRASLPLLLLLLLLHHPPPALLVILRRASIHQLCPKSMSAAVPLVGSAARVPGLEGTFTAAVALVATVVCYYFSGYIDLKIWDTLLTPLIRPQERRK